MQEKKSSKAVEDHAPKAEVAKRAVEDSIDPVIRKIQQRNHRVKLVLAGKLLALGLKRKSVESILHICLPDSDAGD